MASTKNSAKPPSVITDTQAVIQLYAYQQRWFNDRSRFKIGMFARQTGKTFTTTAELVDHAFETELHGGKARWVILSRGERQAKEAMNEGVHKHAQAYGMGFQAYDDTFKAGDVTCNMFECLLPGGSKITALPANPDTARGFSANVFLDEFAFHKDSRAIWAALFPVISAGHMLRITSTPNGKGNKFYDLMTTQPKDGHDDWSRHTVDIYQAISDGLPRDAALLRRALGDDDIWQQEFELKWLDEASAWLSFDLINSCESEFAGLPTLYQGNPCFVGVDIAVRGDLFVIWVLEQIGDVLWTREIVTLKRATFAQQDMELDRVFATYNVARCCIDQTGIGEKPVEDAQTRHGSMRVEGVVFTSPSKLTMATQIKERFEDRRLRIPLGDNVLRADLHKVKKETSSTGTPRFVADRDEGGHADRFWAGALACHAAGQGKASLTIQHAGNRKDYMKGYLHGR
jgi:phage FluMu gp28-like protein